MGNSIVETYRSQFPDTWKSDDEIMDDYASAFGHDVLSQYPDFLKDYEASQTRRRVQESSVVNEAVQGFQRGALGLKSTAAGIGALGADLLGADSAKRYLLDTYKSTNEEIAQEAPASVEKIEQIQGPVSALQYVSGKAGELVPNLGEAAAFAVAGSAIAPGPGTEAGAVGGFFAKQAARSVLRKTVEKTLTADVRRELEEYAAGKIAGKALSAAANKAITEASQLIGGTAASIGNFGALGAGGTFGAVADREGVTPGDAREAALIGAAGSSIGALIPAQILKGILPGLSTPAAKTAIDLYAKKIPAEILTAAGGMGAMEFFNVVAEHHADPKLRDQDFTKEEYSRILNAVATGAIASAPAVGIQALRGVEPKKAAEVPAAEATPAPAVEPGMRPEEVVTQYPVQISPEQALILKNIAEREADGKLTDADKTYLEQLPEAIKAKYQTFKPKREAAPSETKAEAVPQNRFGSNPVWLNELLKPENQDIRKIWDIYQATENPDATAILTGGTRGLLLKLEDVREMMREYPSRVQKAINSVSPLQEAAKELKPEVKAAVEEVIGKPIEEVAVTKAVTQPEEVALGINRPATVDVSLRQLTDQEIGDTRKKATKALDDAEKAYDERELSQSEKVELAALQDKYSSVELEVFRRDAKNKTSADILKDALDIAGQLNLEDSKIKSTEEFQKVSLLLETLSNRRGDKLVDDWFKDYLATSGDAREVYASRWSKLKEVAKLVDPSFDVEKTAAPTPVSKSEQAELRADLAAETATPEEPAPTPVAEVKVSPELSDTAWVASVPESFTAWRVARPGKEKESFYSDLDKDPKRNSKTKALGAFQMPDESIVVATLYKNQGPKVSIPGTQKSWDAFIESGAKPLGYTKLGHREENLYRKYTREQWDKLQPQLEEKANSSPITTVEVPKATAVADRLVEQRPVKEPNRALTRSDAESLANLVERDYGVPTEATARANVGDTLLANSEATNRLREIAEGNTHKLLFRIFETYEEQAAKAEKENLTPAQFKENIIKALTGLRPEDKATRMAIPESPVPSSASPEELANIATHVTERLQRAGIPVAQVKAGIQPLYGSLAKSLGSYDRARQSIVWALSDLTKPTSTDVRVLLEEVGHALFDRESPEMRDAVLRALNKMTQRSPEEAMAVQRDIQTAYPEGVPRGTVMREEVAMGYISRKLVGEGFNPIQARGIAQSVYRLLKEIYLKSAMWFQKNFLGEQYDNPEPAAKYFQNRMESFLAGDAETLSFIDRLGGPKATRQQQLQWSEPVNGTSRDLLEVYNPVTGQIDTNPVLLNSVEAALLNIRDDARFSVPGTPNVPYVDPSVRFNRTIATNNEIIDVRKKAAEAAGVAAEKFRLLNGLKDRNKIAEVVAADAQIRNVTGFNPEQRIGGFKDEGNWKTAWRDASKVLADERAKVGKNLASDKETLPKLEARREREVKELERQIDSYKDAGFMGDLIKRGFRNLLLSDIRKDIQVSRTLGSIAQQYQELTGRAGQPIDRETVGALRRLYTGDLLHGESLFNMLDQLANDPSLDFSRPAGEIRDYIRTQAAADPTLHRYNLLSQDNRQSRALLATVIAYGKLHAREMAMLQMRRMASGEERMALEQQLRDLWKQTREQIDQGVRRVAQAGAIQEVAKKEYRESLRKVASLNRSVEMLRARREVNEKAMPEYNKALDFIASKIQQTSDTTFGDQWKIRVPVDNERGAKFEDRTINLNSSAGPVTTTQEQLAIVNRLADWTAAREAEAANGDPTAMGAAYQDARRQLLEIVNNRFMDHALRNTDHTSTELILSSDIKKLESFGTPTATLIGQKMRQWLSDAQAWRVQADREFGYKNSRLEQQTLGILNRGRKEKVDPRWFNKYVRDASMGFLERVLPHEGVARDTDVANAYRSLGNWLMSQDHIRPYLEGKLDQFMGSLREMIDTLHESGQYWANKNKASEMLVEDPKLGAGQLRSAIPVGLYTFQRKFADSFSNMVHAMRNSGWGIAREDFQRIGELVKAGDIDQAQALIAKYVDNPTHGDTVKTDFIRSLFNVPDESIFDTPALDASGAKGSADPVVVSRAFAQADGDLLRTFQIIHDHYHGVEPLGDYVQSGMMALLGQFEAANNALRKIEPRQASEVKTLTGLIPNAMIDARLYSHWPSEWFTYHTFDRNDNARMAERISGQINFGRDTRVLSNLHQTLKDETDAFAGKLRAVLDQATKETPTGKAKAIDARAEQLLEKDNTPALAHFKTGKQKLDYLRKLSNRQPFVNEVMTGLYDYFDRKNQSEGSLRWGVRFAQALSELMVNNPGSALSQLSTMFDIPLQWGASPSMLKTTGRVIQLTAKDIAGSLVQGFGFKFLPLGKYEQRYRDMLGDPESARKFGDIFATLEGEADNPGAKAWRQFRDLHSVTVNASGERAQYTQFRPLALFYQFVMSSNRALTVGIWELSDKYVTKAAKYLQDHPGTEKITGETLGLKGFEKDGFDRWAASIQNYGLRVEDMASGALERQKNGKPTILTDKELARLYSVALNEVSLESNIATMPLAAFNSSLLRFISPLLGWAYRRTGQLIGKRLDAKDENSLRAASTAMLGLAATGLGGLAVSLVVDAYQEDLVGKKRNIRDLRIPTDVNDLIAIQERIARSGTLGMFGDLMNTAVNVGTGEGDNRMLSADQRIVALQSFQGLMRAVSSLVNQGGDADYSHVVRPMFAALGGNGLLQYAQIANHAFDIDNAESRVVKRINATNYLRVVGRDQGMDLKKSSGGYGTPTPTTPWIARMEYAAYANNPDDFRAAYKGAVAEAKAIGKPDPEDYIRKAFETRHPLRYVYATVPSETEYRKILGAMDEDGQVAVKDAIRLFNYYGAFLGLKPFEGSRKKDEAQSPAKLLQQRLRESSRALSVR